MVPISVIIPAGEGYEELLLNAHTSALALSRDITIIDLGLNAKTRTLLDKKDHTHVVTWEEDVPYIELIREELKKYAKFEWVFFLDPDEVIPQTLVGKLEEALSDEYAFVAIPRKNIILGGFMQHARWWPDYQIRLFKKHAVTWPKALHKPPKTQGMGLTLDPQEEYALEHYNYNSVDELFAKTARYARIEAQEIIVTGQPFSLAIALKKGTAEFISRFFAHEGYKDRERGFIMSFNQLLYYLYVYAYWWEKKGFIESNENVSVISQNFIKHLLSEAVHWTTKLKLSTRWQTVKNKIAKKLLS